MALDELKIINDLASAKEFSTLNPKLVRYVNDFCRTSRELTTQTDALIATGYRHLLGLVLIQKDLESCYKQHKE